MLSIKDAVIVKIINSLKEYEDEFILSGAPPCSEEIFSITICITCDAGMIDELSTSIAKESACDIKKVSDIHKEIGSIGNEEPLYIELQIDKPNNCEDSEIINILAKGFVASNKFEGTDITGSQK